MSNVTIRAALQEHLDLLPVGMLPYSRENTSFTPVTGQPYAEVSLLPAPTDNPTLDQRLRRDMGVFQVLLKYPVAKGSGPAESMARALQQHFPAGLTLTKGGLRIRISKTPDIAAALPVPDRFIIPVSIRYDVFSKGV